MNSLSAAFQKVLDGTDLSNIECESLFEELLNSKDVSKITLLLEAWSAKGATAFELATCAALMRKNAYRVESKHNGLLDIVGTGGSKVKLFNVSTAAAFVAAGAGVAVAKHGNRAATSATASADALSLLGLDLTVESKRAAEILDKIGICFMFAPKFHNLKKELAEARKSISKPTIFNQLGPLANPAGAPFQLIGVSDPEYIEPMSEAVAELGTLATWIVHGLEGIDEISISGKTRVAEIRNGNASHSEIEPEDFGFRKRKPEPIDKLTPEKSVEIISSVLSGEAKDSPYESIVALNAAAAIFVSGAARNRLEASEMALKSIRNGDALRQLRELAAESTL